MLHHSQKIEVPGVQVDHIKLDGDKHNLCVAVIQEYLQILSEEFFSVYRFAQVMPDNILQFP